MKKPVKKLKKKVPTQAPLVDPHVLYAELMTYPCRYFTVNELAYLINHGAAIDAIRLTEIKKNVDARKEKLTKKA